MAFFNTNYTVLFGALLDDHLILSVTYRSDGKYLAVSTQLVLHKDRREPDFISKQKYIWSKEELNSIVDQINAWCDSLGFPKPSWEE